MMYLLDTDHISFIQDESGPEYAVLALRLSDHAPEDVGFSIVSFHEQLLGAHTFISRAKESASVVRGYDFLLKIQSSYSEHPVVAYDARAAHRYELLKALKIRVGTKDLQIAAIAFERGLTLVSRNRRDFEQIPGLKIEDWTI